MSQSALSPVPTILVVTDAFGVISHTPYQAKLERMATTAREYGAQIVPVVPHHFPHEVRGVSQYLRVENVHDPTQVAHAAWRFQEEHALRAILPLRDANVVVAAESRKLLAMPGTRVSTALRARDKLLMKEALREAGLPVADFSATGSFTELNTFFNTHRDGGIVVKPRQESCTTGINLVFDAATLHMVWDRIGKTPEHFLTEAFVNIKAEYHANVILRAGNMLFSGLATYSDPLLKDPFAGDITRHFNLNESENRINAMNLAVLRALGVTDEIVAAHIEYFIDSQDQIYVGEIGLRLPGGSIVDLFEYTTGVHMADAWIRAFLDPTFQGEQHLRVREDVATELFGWEQEGVVESLPSLEDIQQRSPNVVGLEWYVRPGSKVPAATGSSGNRFGHVLFTWGNRPFRDVRREVRESVLSQVKREA